MSFPLEMVLETLEREVSTYQVPVVDLIATQTRDPFRVLVATILSARTRDEVTAAASRRPNCWPSRASSTRPPT